MAIVLAVVAGVAQPAAKADPVSSAGDGPLFESDVLPIFRSHCFDCHGAKMKEAALDIRTVPSIRKGGESGPAVVAGDLERSVLYEMVDEGHMPPEGEKPLTKRQIETIRRWIESGARARQQTGPPSPAEVPMTQHDVVPILLRRCIMCHGPRYQEGELDLRSKDTMLRGGKSGPALMPGDPAESLFIKRIRAHEMPPKKSFGQAGIEPVPDEELAALTRWVVLGAPEVTSAPDVATGESDPLVSAKDRQFWSFQPPREPAVPEVQRGDRAANPIDAFLLRRLRAEGLTFAAEADRLSLLRRATLDLTGLPPEPEEVESFLADSGVDAYERLIDRLLASPRYGERWGRFWLDLAGYADSEGKRHADMIRHYAFRYRDYVVRSFNDDKPYDRFLVEQLAGDELVDYENAEQPTGEMLDNLVATGFLRMAPDGTSANPVNRVEDRIEVMADEIDIFGRGILGLTLKCARCHSHKYDPIPQRDYYRLVAVFKGAYDEYDWMTPQPFRNQWSRSIPRFMSVSTPDQRCRRESHNERIRKAIDTLKSSSQDKAATKKRIQSLKGRLLPEPKIRALWDRGQPSPTYVYRRGNHLNSTRPVEPGVPAVLTDGQAPFEVTPPWPGATSTGRRLALTRWLVRPNHPLTSRVLVNRIWKQHFGRGIVRSLDNFGSLGTLPSHPELLDWLAMRFVRDGWRIKSLHRLIVTSRAYRQVSTVTEQGARLDPDGRLLSRMPMRRMDAEQVYDTMLLVAGQLNERPFGAPDPVDVRGDGLVTATRTVRGWRRSIYVRQRRKEMPTILETFDLPQMNPNCTERIASTVVSQPLHLLNSKQVHDLSAHLADRVLREAGDEVDRQIERVYLIAMARPPTDRERQLGVDALVELADHWSDTAALVEDGETPSPAVSPRRRALADLCHMLMNTAAFVYID